MKEFIKVLEKSTSVKIDCVPKRLDGPEGRDWYGRYVWEVETNDSTFECEWEGFETAEKCIADLIEKMKDKI